LELNGKIDFVLCDLIFLVKVIAGGFTVLFLSRWIKGSSFSISQWALVVISRKRPQGVR
jgi:hypothetical protein